MIEKIEYKREMNRNYMVFRPEFEKGDRYTIQMISGNKIPGLLDFQEKNTNGVSRYYYDITSRQPLKRILEHQSLTAKELKTLISELLYTLEQMERFLLDEGQICLDPSYIYVDPDTFRGYFCLIPGVRHDFSVELFNLVQYLLDHVDHSDGDAVVLAFSMFRVCKKENFGIHDIEQCLDYKNLDRKHEYKHHEYKHKEEKNTKVKDIENEKTGIKDCTIKRDIDTRLEIKPDMESKLGIEPEQKPQKDKGSHNRKQLMGIIFIGILIMGLIPLMIVLIFNIQLLFRWKWYITAIEILILVFIGVGINLQNHSEEPVQDDDEFEIWEQGFVDDFDMNMERDDEKEYIPELLDLSSPIMEQNSDEDMQTVLLTSKNIRSEWGERDLHSLDGTIKIHMGYFPFLIGKSKSMSDFWLNAPGVSRLHVKIEHKDGLYFVTDLNSTNGTEINGVLLEANETKIINIGDELSIANVKFVFR